MKRIKKFRYVILTAILVLAFVHACNMFGCNPAKLQVYECPWVYHMEGVLQEIVPAMSIRGGKSPTYHQWKVFEKYGKERAYFISFMKTQKLDEFYYQSFFAIFRDIPKGISTGTHVLLDFQFVCLGNFFYSKGPDVREKRISIHYAPVIIVNKIDIK